MANFFRLDRDWGFLQALDEINSHYKPGGMVSGMARNVQIQNWGVLVGRTRALAEVELAISLAGSKSKLCRIIQISASSLNMMIDFFESLPNDINKQGIQQGTSISGHLLLRQIGKGGNAVVWKTRTTNNNLHIMKIAKRSKGIALSRFDDEISTLNRIKAINNKNLHTIPIINSYRSLDDDGFAWFTMPEATPLEKNFEKHASTPLTILKGMLDVCKTIEILHTQDIYHRDIKPDNILIYQHKWSLGDFGIATFPDKEKITKEGTKMGSLHYYAPEMLSSSQENSGMYADIYSYAKSLWALLSGNKYPIAGELRLDRPEAKLSTYCMLDKIELLDEVISACTSYTPTNRPSISEIKAVIEKVLENK